MHLKQQLFSAGCLRYAESKEHREQSHLADKLIGV